MKDLKELRCPTSDCGWSVDNHMLVIERLQFILRKHWDKTVNVNLVQRSSGTKLSFKATVIRSLPPAYPNMPWHERFIKIEGEMILSATFASTMSATPALEIQTHARIYYKEVGRLG